MENANLKHLESVSSISKCICEFKTTKKKMLKNHLKSIGNCENGRGNNCIPQHEFLQRVKGSTGGLLQNNMFASIQDIHKERMCTAKCINIMLGLV